MLDTEATAISLVLSKAKPTAGNRLRVNLAWSTTSDISNYSWTARPIVLFAGYLDPSLFPEFIPIWSAIGPFTTNTGPWGIVVSNRHVECLATHGLYCCENGEMSTAGHDSVYRNLLDGMALSQEDRCDYSSGARLVPCSIARTCSSFGGMTGKPSVQLQVHSFMGVFVLQLDFAGLNEVPVVRDLR